MPELFEVIAQLKRDYRLRIAAFGHAGDGNIHVNIMADMTLPGVKQRSEKALDDLFKQIIAWNGAITGEHGIGLAKLPWWKEATSEAVRGMHRRIKQALDPHMLLNPGKFV